jgi:hypothetical protein
MRLSVVIALLGIGLLASCGSQTSGHPTGVLSGGIVYSGQVPYGIPGVSRGKFQAGPVEVMSGSRSVARTLVRAGQEYRFTLPVGQYTVQRKAPRGEGSCPTTVSVTAGSTIRSNVVCVFHGLAASQTAATQRSFRSQDLSFRYPSVWHARQYSEISTMSRWIVYLSNQSMHQPCITRHGTHNTTITCKQPVSQLHTDSILAWWSETGNPAWSFGTARGVPLTVGGRQAKLVITQDSCGVAASVEMDVVVQIPGIADNFYDFIACIRGPAISRLQQQVRELLDTGKFTRT